MIKFLHIGYGPCFGSGSDLGICHNMNKGWSNNGNYLRNMN